MIFVTVGTHGQPFDRLLDSLALLDPAELVVQYGPGRRPPGVAVAEPTLPFDRMLGYYREAEKVITHAGVGSILCARREGHHPLIVPRRHELAEHVDEHQAELTRALEGTGSVTAVWDCAELPGLLAETPARGPADQAGDSPLADAVAEALADPGLRSRSASSAAGSSRSRSR